MFISGADDSANTPGKYGRADTSGLCAVSGAILIRSAGPAAPPKGSQRPVQMFPAYSIPHHGGKINRRRRFLRIFYKINMVPPLNRVETILGKAVENFPLDKPPLFEPEDRRSAREAFGKREKKRAAARKNSAKSHLDA